jgi:hypothetical protein
MPSSTIEESKQENTNNNNASFSGMDMDDDDALLQAALAISMGGNPMQSTSTSNQETKVRHISVVYLLCLSSKCVFVCVEWRG